MYIRTKDGIYKWDCPIENLVGSEIVKRADTIEELCDRFVFKDKKYQEEKNRFTVYTRLFEKKNLPKYIQNGIEIYGAIWTQLGLSYQAKMNEKGEWELL